MSYYFLDISIFIFRRDMNYKKTYFYDFEAFPTFTCVTFKEDKTGEIIQFAWGCGHNDLDKYKKFLENEYLLVGFNNISYDNGVARFIQNLPDAKNLSKKVFELSGRLINDQHRKDDDIVELRYPRNTYYEWDYLDLLKIMHFDRLGVGLKQIAINLKHDLIQDLPYPYDYRISTEEEVQVVLKYNINDVDITEKLYYRIQPQIQLREEISKLYSVNVMNASDSKMGNIILESTYQNELGIDTRKLKDLRTKRSSVLLGSCIPEVISFHTKELKELHEKIAKTKVFAFENFKFEEKIKFRGVGYSIGSGGIHSMEEACRFDSDDNIKIMSCDIGSMYPTCIILNNIYPEHLDKSFVDVLSTLTAERLASKKTNKVKAEALKITVNGLYGKLNSNTFWLEDAKAMLRVTIAGQLYILMLIEMLDQAGIPCISANTDGIECQVKTSKIDTYYSVCKEWESITGFMLEYTQYKSYIKRDVNNYIAIDIDGKVKTKGAFIPEVALNKGYKHPIVAKAVYEYFVNEIPVEDTIRKTKDIFDFCISQKMGKEFKMELKTASGLKQLQRINRFYISNFGGYLQKRNVNDGRVIGLFVKRAVQLLNEYNAETPFEKYNVNIEWYIKEAKSMIEEIEPSAIQLGMFGVDVDYGKKLNFNGEEVKKKKQIAPPKQITENEIRYDSSTKRLVYDIDTRYAVVTLVETKYSPRITFYYLSKGTINKFKINKDLFAKQPLKNGDVVCLSDFENKNRWAMKDGYSKPVKLENEFEYWLTEYSQVTDFSEFKRKINDN